MSREDLTFSRSSSTRRRQSCKNNWDFSRPSEFDGHVKLYPSLFNIRFGDVSTDAESTARKLISVTSELDSTGAQVL